ncbi:MAG: glycogen-binding domain-containing protein [Gemmatimonadaceae bacterium]
MMMLNRRSIVLVPMAVACAWSGVPRESLRAQAAVTQLAVTGGRMTDERGIRSDAVTLAPGVIFRPAGPVSLALSGNATRLDNSQWQAGGSAGLSARTAEWAHAALSLAGSGSVTRTSYGASFVVGDVTPAIEMRFGGLTVFGGAHVASGRTTMRAQPTTAAPVVLTSMTRTWRAPVYGAEWRLSHDESVPLTLAYHEERARTSGETVVDRSADAYVALGRLTLGATAGRRRAPSEHVDFWTGSASLELTPSLALQAASGTYPSSRLTGAAPGSFVSIGLVLRRGAPRPRRLPSPRGVEAPPQGRIRLSIRAPEATRVEIAGDWNDWTPFAARRAANGVWYADLALAPGDYRYAFRLDGREWRVPDGAVVSDDGFGGKAAYVTVARTAANSRTNLQEER